MSRERRPSLSAGSIAFRRTLSLTSLSFGRHSTSTSSTLPNSPHPLPTPQSRPRLSAALSTPLFDPEAAHYQDPEARKKLRLYLSCSQKFDEAVEFGFPSTAVGGAYPSFQLPPIATDTHSFSRHLHTLLGDDTLSFLDDADDDEDEDQNAIPDGDSHSVAELESPLTPSSTGLSFHCHTRQPSASDICSPDPSVHGPIHPMPGRFDREMTLRMTLTRPDLRASEDALYGWRNPQGGKKDLFALEEGLCLPSDAAGAEGPLTVKSAGSRGFVSRLFKKVKGRP